MRIALLTPGTGSFHCGVCLRDDALVRALGAAGHDARILPMYLPLVTEGEDPARGAPIFFGGVNVYLREHIPLLRRAPGWVDRLLDSRLLLRWAARRAGMTQGPDLGALTLSMLRGSEGTQEKELDRLIRWLRDEGRPEAVCLSTGLQIGLARPLREALGVPVVCSLQGEDAFLDGLARPHDALCWDAFRKRAPHADALVAPSHFYARRMADRLGIDPGRIHTIPNGIDPTDFGLPSDSTPDPPALGYMARLCEAKGFPLLIDAFIRLRAGGRFPRLRLLAAGAMTGLDTGCVAAQRRKLGDAGLADQAEIVPNIDRASKIALLRRLTVFSVPTLHHEAFGLYLLEAMAAGVPIVQPRHGAFPELIESTGAGLLCEPCDAGSLADTLARVLEDPAQGLAMGRRGRHAIETRYSIAAFARAFAGLLERLARRG